MRGPHSARAECWPKTREVAVSGAQGGGGGLPGPLRLPDPGDLLDDASFDQLDFAGVLELARAFIDADAVEHASTLAMRAVASAGTKRRTLRVPTCRKTCGFRGPGRICCCLWRTRLSVK